MRYLSSIRRGSRSSLTREIIRPRAYLSAAPTRMSGQEPENAVPAESRPLRSLYDLSADRGLNQAQDPADLVRLIAEQARELLQGDAAAVYVWDEWAGLLVPVYSNDPRLTLEDRPVRDRKSTRLNSS